MKKKRSNYLLLVGFLIGLGFLLYPTASDYYNSLHQSRAVADYSAQVSNLKEDEYQELLQQANLYNQKLA